MAKEVKFTIKLNVDGKEQIVEATTAVQKLTKELGIAKTNSDEMRNSLLKMNNVTQTLRNDELQVFDLHKESPHPDLTTHTKSVRVNIIMHKTWKYGDF